MAPSLLKANGMFQILAEGSHAHPTSFWSEPHPDFTHLLTFSGRALSWGGSRSTQHLLFPLSLCLRGPPLPVSVQGGGAPGGAHTPG